MDSNIRTGTITGTILVLLLHVNFTELLSSAVLAAVGATVSFGVSVFWRLLLKRFMKK